MSFNEGQFRGRVSEALRQAQTVLDNERRPGLAGEQQHSWGDKYELAECVVRVATAAAFNCLERLGVNARALERAKAWAVRDKKAVLLRLRAEERCVFDKEVKREVVTSKHVSDYGVGTITDKVVTTVTDYYWNFSVDYSLSLVAGTSDAAEDSIVLQTRVGRCAIITSAKSAPRKEVVVRDAIDGNITWLLGQLDDANKTRFTIDRDSPKCRTPRRNPQSEEAIDALHKLENWADAVQLYFKTTLFPVERPNGHNVSLMNDGSVFVPVVPLFDKQLRRSDDEDKDDGGENDKHQSGALVRFAKSPAHKGPTLRQNDLNRFLGEERRGLSEKLDEMARVFPDGGGVVTAAEANIVVAASHAQRVSQYLEAALDYIEDLILKQLTQAIGKVLTPSDFAEYMVFHNRKVYGEEFQPRAFCYAVRRPDHYPEGIVSIEAESTVSGQMADPILTMASRMELAPGAMQFTLGAGVKVAFGGEAFVHGYVRHTFAGEGGQKLTLNVRARQFSSFLVLVGRVTGPTTIDPQYGIIVQNKDEVTIPLELETIPSATEFKKATVSISPEMQQFAQLYRGMQLSSTLFGVCVLQIKPQLEKVLNMTNEALTKEIRLTQDLLKMFIEYQIPSDMLSFAGRDDASKEARIAAVKRNVRMMEIVIAIEKMKESYDKLLEAEQAALENARVNYKPVVHEIDDLDDLLQSIGSMVSEQSVSLDVDESVSFDKGSVHRAAPTTFKRNAFRSIQRESEPRESSSLVETEAKPVANSRTAVSARGRAPTGSSAPTAKSTAAPEKPVVQVSQTGKLGKVSDGTIANRSGYVSDGKPLTLQKQKPAAPVAGRFAEAPVVQTSERMQRVLTAKLSMSSLASGEHASYAKDEAAGEALDGLLMDLQSEDRPYSRRRSVEVPLGKTIAKPVDLGPSLEDVLNDVRAEFKAKHDELDKEKQGLQDEHQALQDAAGDDGKTSAGAIVPSSSQSAIVVPGRDVSKIPGELDARLEKLDKEGALRPTIINVGKQWVKRAQKALADSRTTERSLGPDEQKLEKNTCYDLLDALTKSGGMPIEGATLHVVIASTHIFGKSVFDTLVKDNVNPIERVERSQLIVASAVHGKTAAQLLKAEEAERCKQLSPELF